MDVAPGNIHFLFGTYLKHGNSCSRHLPAILRASINKTEVFAAICEPGIALALVSDHQQAAHK